MLKKININTPHNWLDGLCQTLFNTEFSNKSESFQKGFHDALNQDFNGMTSDPPPFDMGSAERDAYYFGVQEGHLWWRCYVVAKESSCAVYGE